MLLCKGIGSITIALPIQSFLKASTNYVAFSFYSWFTNKYRNVYTCRAKHLQSINVNFSPPQLERTSELFLKREKAAFRSIPRLSHAPVHKTFLNHTSEKVFCLRYAEHQAYLA